MSMTLTYIDQNDNPQGIINISEGNYTALMPMLLEGCLSETNPNVDMNATDWLEAFSTLIRPSTEERILNYCRHITERIARILATEGNPRCYWA